MSPQPVRTLTGYTAIRPLYGHVERLPTEMAALVGQVIGAYAALDLEVTKLTTQCLGSPFLTVCRMLEELNNSVARRRIVELVVAEAFSDSDEYAHSASRVLARISSARKRRAPLAHDLWGEAEGRPDVLILVPPEEYSIFHAAQWEAHARVHAEDPDLKERDPTEYGRRVDDRSHGPYFPDRGVYYTDQELKRFIGEMKTTSRLCADLRTLLSDVNADVKEKARDRLSEELSKE